MIKINENTNIERLRKVISIAVIAFDLSYVISSIYGNVSKSTAHGFFKLLKNEIEKENPDINKINLIFELIDDEYNSLLDAFLQKHYIETEEERDELLKKAEIKYLYNKKQLIHGCIEFCKNRTSPALLSIDLENLGQLSFKGIEATKAGEQLRLKYLLDHTS